MRNTSTAAKALLLNLIENCDDEGRISANGARPTVTDLSRWGELDPRTAKRAFAELESCGAISISEDGFHYVSAYGISAGKPASKNANANPPNSTTYEDQEEQKKIREGYTLNTHGESPRARGSAPARNGSKRSAPRWRQKMFPDDQRQPLPAEAGGRVVALVLDRCDEILGTHCASRFPGFDRMMVEELEAHANEGCWVEAIAFPVLKSFAHRVDSIPSLTYLRACFRKDAERMGFHRLTEEQRNDMWGYPERIAAWRRKAG